VVKEKPWKLSCQKASVKARLGKEKMRVVEKAEEQQLSEEQAQAPEPYDTRIVF
jgi:hypothetical protein